MDSKILSREQLAFEAQKIRAEGKRIVATNGCFDVLHIGHLRFLQSARQLGDVLIVGVNSDESVSALKGTGRPIVPANERAELLAGMLCVDYVSIFPETMAQEFLRAVKPDVYVKGGDYQTGEVPEAPLVESLGGQVKMLELTPDHSTSDLIAKIKGHRD